MDLTSLEVCKNSSFKEASKDNVLPLSNEELMAFIKNAKQCQANLGVLCKAEAIDDGILCFKKLILITSCWH